MNKRKCTIQLLMMICFLAGSYAGYAQGVVKPELQWANGLTGDGSIDDASSSIFVEKAEMDNVVHVGTYGGTIDFDPGAGNMDSSTTLLGLYIWKGDKDGRVLWVKTINYEEMSPVGFPQFQITAVTVDQDNGDIYLSGIFGDTTIDFDPGPGVNKLVPGNTSFGMYWPSLFILKLNVLGDFQWVKQLDVYNDGGIRASAISKQIGGENKLIYFSGYANPFMDYDLNEYIPYDFDPGPDTAHIRVPSFYGGTIGYILCLNDRGEFVWVRKIAEGNDLINFFTENLAVDESGIFVSGMFSGTADVNPAPAVYNMTGNYDLFLLKYKLNGDLEWARQSEVGSIVSGGVEIFSRIGTAWGGNKMGLDVKGNVYLSVDFNGPINFNKMLPWGGPATLINASWYSIAGTTAATALVRYNNNGDFEWVKQIGGGDTVSMSTYSRLSVADDGKVYLAGNFNSSIDLDPGPDSFRLTGSGRFFNGSGNSYVAQYDTSGKFIWGGQIPEGTSATSYSHITGLKSDEGGILYLSGCWAGGTTDCDPGPGSFILTSATDASSAFVLKLQLTEVDTTDNGNGTDTSSSINNSLLAINMKVYPNPTSGLLDVESSRILNNAAITITNIVGRGVFQKTALYGQNFQFDLRALSAGTYFLELREGEDRRVYKLVKR